MLIEVFGNYIDRKNKMLTILVEIMMSVFIANFKASEHPIINIVVRGILIMITIFFLDCFLPL
ncbi:hypothetical protein GCM10025882_23030 [Acinetobacter gyllenbergii]|nr:hypothetical protein GCM10025882_23030 [Acinetobacter gyllenbergii]